MVFLVEHGGHGYNPFRPDIEQFKTIMSKVVDLFHHPFQLYDFQTSFWRILWAYVLLIVIIAVILFFFNSRSD